MTYGLRDMEGLRVELCDQCGFDQREPRDLGAALTAVFESLERLQDRPDASRRPEPETWSATEYAEHCVDVTAQTLTICRRALGLEESQPTRSLQEAAAATVELVEVLTDAQRDTCDGRLVRCGYAKLALADGTEVVTSRGEG